MTPRPVHLPGLAHPSGRPDHRRPWGARSILRVPHDEPLTPGLRRPQRVEAIGFWVDGAADYDDNTNTRHKHAR